MRSTIIVVLSFLFTHFTFAQVTHEIFESFKLQERRNVSYYFPEDYTPEKKYPVVVVLDAEYLFDQVVANAKFYSRFEGMPEVIVVGIDQNAENLRWEDCAFEEDTGLPTDKGKMFYEFIGMEIVPYLDTKFSTAPFRMFIGYGITANFGNYYLFKDQSFFNAFISIAPRLAPEMEVRVPERLLALEQQIFYHLITGGTKQKSQNGISILDQNLKSIQKPTLHYSLDVYPEAGELSVVTYGLGKAWEKMFEIFKPITPKEYKEQILTSEEPVFQYLEDKYGTIEELFGFRKDVSLNDIMAIYAAARKKEDFESLKALSDLCKKQYPDTMMGFYFEGEYYEYLGEAKKALRTFEKAFGMQEIDFLTKELALEKIDALKADFGF